MKSKYLIYFLIFIILIGVLVIANTQGRISAASQQNELLFDVACDDPVRFKQILNSMSLPEGEHSGPIKDNPEIWEAVKQKMIDKCRTLGE